VVSQIEKKCPGENEKPFTKKEWSIGTGSYKWNGIWERKLVWTTGRKGTSGPPPCTRRQAFTRLAKAAGDNCLPRWRRQFHRKGKRNSLAARQGGSMRGRLRKESDVPTQSLKRERTVLKSWRSYNHHS